MIVPAEGDSSTVPRFASSAGLDLAGVVAAFEEHGAVIVERGEEYTAGMHAQLQEHWAEAEEDEEDGGDGFYPGNTKRTVGLVTRAPAVHPPILDEVGLGICDGHLLPNCDEYSSPHRRPVGRPGRAAAAAPPRGRPLAFLCRPAARLRRRLAHRALRLYGADRRDGEPASHPRSGWLSAQRFSSS